MARLGSVTDAVDRTDPHEPHDRPEPGARPALLTFVLLELAAFPMILFLGRDRWFFSDEFDFLVTRRAGNIASLLRPHNGHWSTLPILTFRLLWSLFGLHSYLPYQVMVVGAHLAVVALLRVVMRRAGVSPWLATVVAASLLLFGGGLEDIVWAFQIGFVGAFGFGLGQLILTDHDGGWRGRDWLGLLCGAAALACSGVGLAMVVIVGMATWSRRGWRISIAQVLPLLAIYTTWWATEDRSTVTNPDHRSLAYVGEQIVRWDLRGSTWTLTAIGHSGLVGVALGLVVLAGLYEVVRTSSVRELRRRLSVVAALAVGALVFLTTAGWARWSNGVAYARQSRYTYLTAAMILPACAVAIEALGRRRRIASFLAIGLLLVGVPGNISMLSHNRDVGDDQVADRIAIEAVAGSPLLDHVPAASVVDPKAAPYLDVAWLRRAVRDGKLDPIRSPTRGEQAEAAMLLGFRQLRQGRTGPTSCQPASRETQITPPRGTTVSIGTGEYGVSNWSGSGWSPVVLFEPSKGVSYLVQLPGLRLRIRSEGRDAVRVCEPD